MENLWESYNELGKMAVEGEMSKEDFEKQISAFSSFLSEMNLYYHYNGTYLQQYVKEFLLFLNCFYNKYEVVKKLFAISAQYAEVTLVIDRYWQQESTFGEESNKIFSTKKVFPFCEKHQVCNDVFLIECSVLCETKRYIYHNKVRNNENEIQEELYRLKKFLDDKAKLRKDSEL